MSNAEAGSSAITIGDVPTDSRGVAPAAPAAAAPPAATKRAPRFAFLYRKSRDHAGWKRGLAFFDFILRIFAIGAVLTAAITMGTTDETLPFYTQFFQFHANFSDLPALTWFVVGNAIAGGYLVLSLPFSFACVVRPRAVGLRLLLLIFDTVMLALTTAAAASAASIVYLAHTGDTSANWVAICIRFDGFCQRISGAVVISFVAVVIFMVLVVMSALVLRKH